MSSSVGRITVVRLEKHCVVDGTVYGTGGFPAVLAELSRRCERLVLVLPIVPPGSEFDGWGASSSDSSESRLGYRLRTDDVLVALPNMSGYVRALLLWPFLVIGLLRARLLSDAVILRLPEHVSLVSLPLSGLWRRRAIWYVAERVTQVERGFKASTKAVAERLLAGLEKRFLHRLNVVANGSHLGALAGAGVEGHKVFVTVSTTLSAQISRPYRTKRAEQFRIGNHRVGRVLFVGRIVPSKGLETLLRAVRLARSILLNRPTVRLVGWGDEKYVADLRTMAHDLGLSDCVDFVGPVAFGPTLFEEMDRADIFVMPSVNSEGTPRALAEAISLGVPSIGSDQSGLRDVFGPLLLDAMVEPYDDAALADLLVQLDQDVEYFRSFASRTLERGSAITVGAVVDALCSALE